MGGGRPGGGSPAGGPRPPVDAFSGLRQILSRSGPRGLGGGHGGIAGGPGFRRGLGGVGEVGRGRGHVLVARLAAKLVVSRDGAVAGENLHLTEDGFIPLACLI